MAGRVRGCLAEAVTVADAVTVAGAELRPRHGRWRCGNGGPAGCLPPSSSQKAPGLYCAAGTVPKPPALGDGRPLASFCKDDAVSAVYRGTGSV